MAEETNYTNTQIIDQIIANAIQSRASDIHFEPEREGFNIRLRIDGLLYPIQTLEKYAQEELISRIKVISQIDITEHRFPQDGHFEFPHIGRIYNIRVSTIPSTYGETVVFRIHNREDILIALDQLGLEPDQLELLKKLIHSPSGMLLITGPTGSGKTNLLYSVLNDLNKPDKNIIALEDPIEYQMQGVRQTEISDASGLTFARALRSVVRQDPDVIMLGEIRDSETAQMAFQASLTGVLVFSTFHTFDVGALVNRLSEMGVTNSIMAQAINGVVLTRLVRKICTTCKQRYVPTQQDKKLMGDLGSAAYYKGQGCPTCQNHGYLGRTGVFQIIEFDEDFKAAVMEHQPTLFIKELMAKKNIKKLHEIALKKAQQGITTLEEIQRVIA